MNPEDQSRSPWNNELIVLSEKLDVNGFAHIDTCTYVYIEGSTWSAVLITAPFQQQHLLNTCSFLQKMMYVPYKSDFFLLGVLVFFVIYLFILFRGKCGKNVGTLYSGLCTVSYSKKL